jgi:dTDP-4-dehydrorhamnose reductase
MKVLVTGGKGALGQDVAQVFAAAGHEVITLDRDGLDITNREVVQRVLGELMPELVINCAAYNLVDKVEEPDVYPFAHAINALGPQFLAEASKDISATFVHISTDYVFDGTKPEGYDEQAMRSPISKYGQTKAMGEELVEAAGGKYFIVRTSRLFGKPATSADAKESFVMLMLRLAAIKPELSIVDEEVGCPTYTLDLAHGLLKLLQGEYEPGIYHLINSGPGITWYGFAEEIFALKNVTTPRKPVSSQDFPKPAARPKFAALLSTKFPLLRARSEALKDFLQS